MRPCSKTLRLDTSRENRFRLGYESHSEQCWVKLIPDLNFESASNLWTPRVHCKNGMHTVATRPVDRIDYRDYFSKSLIEPPSSWVRRMA